MTELRKTALHGKHVALGARMVEFGGWEMPLHYEGGIVDEHLKTRRYAGLFDVSHMGRFAVRGEGALAFLQRALTGDATALAVGQSQYTILANEQGGAVDDAYLYRFVEDEYLLVVNASNREKDWEHLGRLRSASGSVEMTDDSDRLAMISLQGPRSGEILEGVVASGDLPQPRRNALSIVTIGGMRVLAARTGYTGEPACFELFVPSTTAGTLWEALAARGAWPVGLGARDTLRLEAGLPLYGHELGPDEEGREMAIFASAVARRAVSFAAAKGGFVGREALLRQREELTRLCGREVTASDVLPRLIVPIAVAGRRAARAGARVLSAEGRDVGRVTSGTIVPYWKTRGAGPATVFSGETGMRAIGLALVDSRLATGERIRIDIRGREACGRIVGGHLRTAPPPFARPVVHEVSEDCVGD